MVWYDLVDRSEENLALTVMESEEELLFPVVCCGL